MASVAASSDAWWLERQRLGEEFPPPPPHRMESMRGPAFSNWIIRGHVLQGPHPANGAASADATVRVLRELLEAGVTTFVCLQDEMPTKSGTSSGAGAASGTRYGAPSARFRSTYGSGNVVSAKPYLDQAQMVADAAGLPQAAGGRQLSFIHVPIRDADGGIAPDAVLKRLVTDLTAHIRAGEVLYLHCGDGNGRSGAVAAALLGCAYGMSSSEAIDAVQRSRNYRPGAKGLSPESHEQKMQAHRVLGNTAFREAVAAEPARPSGSSGAAAARQASSVLAHVRTLLQRRGAVAICRFRAFLGDRCDAGEGHMSPAGLADALSEAGLYLTAAETESVLHWLGLQPDADVAGLDVNALVDGVRGSLPQGRRALIHAVFRKMDSAASRFVAMDDIAVAFDAEGHPDVRSGRRSSEEVLAEFMSTFGVDSRGREVSLEEFRSYWWDVSGATPEDNAFKMVMWGVWGLDGSELGDAGRSAGLGSSQHRDGVDIVPASPGGHAHSAAYGGRQSKSSAEAAAALRASLLKHGGEFAVAKLGAALRDVAARDPHGEGGVELADFRAALRGAGAPMNTEDERCASECFVPLSNADRPIPGRRPAAPASALEAAVVGNLSQSRQRLAASAFSALDRRWRGEGAIPARELAGMFMAERHPSVTAGRRPADAVMRDFLASLGRGDPRDGMVRLPLFESLCAGMAAAHPEDAEFSLVLWQSFDLSAASASHGSTVHRPRTAVEVHHGLSVASRADAGEMGFLDGVDRLASAARRPGTGPRSDSQRQHFASHPAKHTSAIVVGSATHADSPLTSPYASRAGYGLGAAGAAASRELADGSRVVVGRPEDGRIVAAQTVLDFDSAAAPGDASGLRVLSPSARPPSASQQRARMAAGGDAAVPARRLDPALTRERGGDGGRRSNPAAEAAIRADSTRALVAGGGAAPQYAAQPVKSGARPVDPTAARIRELANSRGVRGVFALLRWLGIGITDRRELSPDPDTRAVESGAFARRLREHGLGLSEAEANRVAAMCADDDVPGHTQLFRVFELVCPPLSAGRRQLVDQAFDALAAKAGVERSGRGDAVIPVGSIRLAYASGRHPQVVASRRSEADVLREFLESFFPAAAEETVVRRQDFEAYNRAMAAGLPDPDDTYFAALLWSVWELQSAPTAATAISDPTGRSAVPAAGRGSAPTQADHLSGAGGVPSPSHGLAGSPRRRAAGGMDGSMGGGSSGPSSPVRGRVGNGGTGIERMGWTPAVNVARHATSPPSPPGSIVTASAGGPVAVCERLGRTLNRRGPSAFLDLAHSLREAAGGAPGPLPHLTAAELQAALSKASVGLSPSEMRVILDGMGDCVRVDSELMLRQIVGPVTPARRELIGRAWTAASGGGTGPVSAAQAAAAFRTEALTEVRTGRKSRAQATAEFIGPLLEAGGFGASPEEVAVGPEEWHRHFAMVSAGISDDSAFRLLMWESFGLGA